MSGLFNEIANSKKESFTNLIAKISEQFKHDLDWWLARPASRNTIGGSFFHYYCSFYLFAKLVNDKYKISEISVDSSAFAKILKQYLDLTETPIHVKNTQNLLISYLRVIVRRIPKELLIRFYKFRYSKKTRYLEGVIPDNSLTLIDTFVTPGASEEHYYNGLWDKLTKEQKASTFFVPTLGMFSKKQNIAAAYEELRRSERNFLIKEDYLNVKDLLFALGHYFRVLKMKVNPIYVLGVDMSPLIKEELRLIGEYSNTVEGLLNYRFAQKLSESKVKLHLVIDWWENQPLDKGWNAGFNKFYPKTPTIGYMGYVPSLLQLHFYPTETEYENCVLPKKIATIGKGFVESVKMYCHYLDLINAPAFRFQHVWNATHDKRELKSVPFTIFVALTYFAEESFGMLRMAKNGINKMASAEFRFWVKPHPTMSEEKLKNGFGKKWPEEFIVVSGDSSDYLPHADVLISKTSSICLETLALGVPVIVADNLSTLRYNPIPEGVPQEMWRFCKTTDDIVDAIKFYKSRDSKQIEKYRKIGARLRRNYFSPVTKEGVIEFLMLN